MWNPFRRVFRKRYKPPPPDAHWIFDAVGEATYQESLVEIEALARQGSVVEALTRLEALDVEAGELGPAHLTRSYILMLQEDYASSEDYAERAIHLLADQPMLSELLALAWNNRGYARRMQHRFNAALTDLHEAVRVDGWLIVARENLIACLDSVGDYVAAAEQAETLLKMAADKRAASKALAMVRWHQEDFDGAVKAADYGLARAPDCADLLFDHAYHLSVLKRFEAAEAHVARLEQLAGAAARAQAARGWIAYYQGDLDGALEVAEKDSAGEEALVMLKVSILDARADHEGLKQYAESLLRVHPKQEQFARYVIDSEYSLGNTAAAADFLRRWLGTYPESPALRVRQMNQLALTGDIDAASKLGDQLLCEYPKREDVFADGLNVMLLTGQYERVVELASGEESPHLAYHAKCFTAAALAKMGEIERARESADAAAVLADRSHPCHYPSTVAWRIANAAAVRAGVTGDDRDADEAMERLAETLRLNPGLRNVLPIWATLQSLRTHPKWQEVTGKQG